MNLKHCTAVLLSLGISPLVLAQAMLEEVIVTAQKREQGLQDVPIAVQAFSSQRIDQLTAQDIGDLDSFTPNVEIDRGSNQPEYRIRGIGTSDFGVGADPAVGVYIDGPRRRAASVCPIRTASRNSVSLTPGRSGLDGWSEAKAAHCATASWFARLS